MAKEKFEIIKEKDANGKVVKATVKMANEKAGKKASKIEDK